MVYLHTLPIAQLGTLGKLQCIYFKITLQHHANKPAPPQFCQLATIDCNFKAALLHADPKHVVVGTWAQSAVR